MSFVNPYDSESSGLIKPQLQSPVTLTLLYLISPLREKRIKAKTNKILKMVFHCINVSIIY